MEGIVKQNDESLNDWDIPLNKSFELLNNWKPTVKQSRSFRLSIGMSNDFAKQLQPDC